MNQPNWRRVAAGRVSRMTPAQADAALAAIRAEGITANHPTIRAITGGVSSQSVNAVVIRQLAVRAGRLPKVH